MFVDQLLLMDLFSQLHYLNNNVGLTAEYKSLKSCKIDTIDLTQQFSLSILP